MTMVTMKHGGTWDILGATFRIKGPTFEKLITGYLRKLSLYLFDKMVTKLAEGLDKQSGAAFKNFPSALYATDVTFQHANRPSGNTAQGKVYYSGKHHLYGLKVKVSVLPDG